jgi:hypothetical protein
MRKQVETWQRSELTDAAAKVVIYEAFVEGKLEAPKQLARTFKELDPIPQFKATAKLGEAAGRLDREERGHWLPESRPGDMNYFEATRRPLARNRRR